MNENPQVSVIMAAYNAQATIRLAIQSALEQSLRDLELVICDDASSDATYDIASSFKDRRIRILRNEKNLGAGKSRDLAIETARGKWIALLDADDAWHQDRLQRLLLAAKADPTAMVFDDIMVCHHHDGMKLIPWRPVHGARAFGSKRGRVTTIALEDYIQSDRLLIQPLIPTESIRANKIRHTHRRFGEDAEFLIRLGLAGLKFKYVPEALYFYRITPGSATSRSDREAMREMLQSALSWSEITTAAKIAIENKVSKLKSEEYVYKAVERAKKGEIIGALAMFASQPNHFFRSWKKIVKGVCYRANHSFTRMARTSY